MIFKTFPELSKAYSLKELYRNMNKDCSYDEAFKVYDDRKPSNSFTENVNVNCVLSYQYLYELSNLIAS